MSKDEYKDIHLSDERMEKAPHLYGKSWTAKDAKLNKLKYSLEQPHESKQRNRSCDSNEPHDNVYIIIRKKRSILPLQVDW